VLEPVEPVAFSAVRTTHAAGAGFLLTVRHDAHARAKASSNKIPRRVLVGDADQVGAQAIILGPTVELREVHSLGTHSLNAQPPAGDYTAHAFRRPASRTTAAGRG
jgi:hypothetical protein